MNISYRQIEVTACFESRQLVMSTSYLNLIGSQSSRRNSPNEREQNEAIRYLKTDLPERFNILNNWH
jgi:hypothetical protein